jgi:hypothetical protein
MPDTIWPEPNYDAEIEPHFLFIITPPFSGSTALSQILNTSHRTMLLHERGEGQWLIPGLCDKQRWNPEKEVNYASVKAVWLNKYQSVYKLTKNIDVVIEKSPPSMIRIEALASQFKSVSFLANNRNPYANCASILYRNYQADEIGNKKRSEVLTQLTNGWMRRSSLIQKLIKKLEIPLLTYEEFCDDPSILTDRLDMPAGVIETINTDAKVKVKDYQPQIIINQNERQIANLSDEEIDLMGSILTKNLKLLCYYGYDVI